MIERRMSEKFSHPLGFCTWGEEEIEAATECLRSQKTTMWTKCFDFEDQFAAYLGSTDAVMVNSGSSADLIMMLVARELGMLKPGDEVLIPAVTWPTQAWAVIQAGFKPKFVDVDIETLNATPEAFEAAIGPKTKAIFLVHLMGNPCDMEYISGIADDRGLLLFEDCCEAFGASFALRKVGSVGTASAFSFFASHHISTMEGGMVATSNPDFAEGCRLMRAHGWARDLKRAQDVDVLDRYGCVTDRRYLFLGQGFNFRPTELQGAIGQIQLKKLDGMNEWRAKNARQVHTEFRVTNGPTVESLLPVSYRSNPAWFALPFVLRSGLPYTRQQVFAHLAEYGIDSRPIVGGNLLRHPAFAKYADCADGLPGANAIHDRGFYIGLPPTDKPMNAVIGALNSIDPMLRQPQ